MTYYYGQDEDRDDICSNCGARMVDYTFVLNHHLVKALKRLYDAGGDAHLKDLELEFNQRTNFTRLKFWGLVSPNELNSGNWILTKHGREFIETNLSIPKRVITYRNTFKEYKEPVDYVTFAELYYAPAKVDKTYKKREDYIADSRDFFEQWRA